MDDFAARAQGELVGIRVIVERLRTRIHHRDIDDMAEVMRTTHAEALADLSEMTMPSDATDDAEMIRSYALAAIDRILVEDKAATTPSWWHAR
ncbi:hypothetical protein ACLBXM_18025 [Xanthobacteraceae bacterium A53D]